MLASLLLIRDKMIKNNFYNVTCMGQVAVAVKIGSLYGIRDYCSYQGKDDLLLHYPVVLATLKCASAIQPPGQLVSFSN